MVRQHGNGPTWKVKLFCKKESTRFDNYTAREAPPEVVRG